MGEIASDITSLAIVFSTAYSVTDHRKHQSSASLAFVRGIHRWPVNSPHKWPETRKMFPFDDVIMKLKLSIGALPHLCSKAIDILIQCVTKRIRSHDLLRFPHGSDRPRNRWHQLCHVEVIKWKHFPCYWPFVRGIHRAPVNSLHKGQWRRALAFSLICVLKKRLSKQSWGRWFETPSRPLWRHRNAKP